MKKQEGFQTGWAACDEPFALYGQTGERKAGARAPHAIRGVHPAADASPVSV